jgi:hypothetical protein
VPEVLAAIADSALNQEWQGQRDTHLTLEEALEAANLKRKGDRRDQTGGGARTYVAWLASLGLIFKQENSKQLKLTLAGEAIMEGQSPVSILKGQVLKYQFPSSFSLSRGVNVSQRFKIRPFRFLLKMLTDARIEGLSEEEIAKIVIIEAENETSACYEKVVSRVFEFRADGDKCLEPDFISKYASAKGGVNLEHPYRHLTDIANTIVNWLEYTQLAKRDDDRLLRFVPDKAEEVSAILQDTPAFIDRPAQHEYFQRKFGLDPKRKKDTRNLSETRTITASIIAEHKVKQAFIGESLKSPIGKVTADLIDKIADQTGIEIKFVEETLLKLYPRGAVGSFMSEYFEMAFRGRDDAVEFEKATAELFRTVFGFEARHVGPIGLTPDVLLLSDADGYCGIVDNKAYSRYTINNDHRNRMIHNYIGGLQNYYNGTHPLAFFTYIAGGFGKNIDGQIRDIFDETEVCGSAFSVSNVIALVERNAENPYTHNRLRELFAMNKQVLLGDIA